MLTGRVSGCLLGLFKQAGPPVSLVMPGPLSALLCAHTYWQGFWRLAKFVHVLKGSSHDLTTGHFWLTCAH